MKQASPLMRWNEIVHPLFWPVFFWNLRRFAVYMRNLVAETGGNALIHYEVTWWGGIRVYRSFKPDGAKWDDGLEGSADRMHLATLDVLNPWFSTCPPMAANAGLRFALLSATFAQLPLPGLDSCARQAWARLNAGSFAEPAHLNTS